MKCDKCKNELKKGSNYCTNCGNKINVIKIIIINIVNILLYVLSAILFLFTLMGWASDKSFLEGLLLFISAVFTCPLTYRIIARYLKPIDKVYIRVIVIIFCFVIGISISPSSQNTPEKNEDKSQGAIDETDKQSEQENKDREEKLKKEQEELEIKKKEEELRVQQEEVKKQEQQKAQQEEAKRQGEQRAKEERIRNGETELNNGKFTLKAGHKGYFDGFSYYIEGELVNNKSKKYSYVQIEFNLYDSNGVQLGSAIANINNLEANGTWKFKAIDLCGNSESIKSYKVVDVTAF